MFFFVSEPSLDPGGSGSASFCVGAATTIHCSSMSQAQELSQRMRAALRVLASRGARPRRWPSSDLPSIADWIDELVGQGLSSETPILSISRRDDFERPK